MGAITSFDIELNKEHNNRFDPIPETLVKHNSGSGSSATQPERNVHISTGNPQSPDLLKYVE
jgi:hypothetical protein